MSDKMKMALVWISGVTSVLSTVVILSYSRKENISGSTELASYNITRDIDEPVILGENKSQRIERRIKGVVRKIAQIMGQTDERSESCNPSCQVGQEVKEKLYYEKIESCEPERLKWQSRIEKIPIEFRQYQPGSRSAEFPRKCILYSLLNWPAPNAATKSDEFGYCKYSTGIPFLGEPDYLDYKPCVTEEYVNIIYNTFVDVMSCLNIPQRDLIPKLMLESGFHFNAGNPKGSDAGVGQLTEEALVDVGENYDSFIKELQESSNPSCQRILQQKDAIKLVTFKGNKSRCNIMSPPHNPLRNIFYLGILYRQMQNHVNNYYKNYEIDILMSRAGLSGYSSEALKKMLVIMSYNTGPRTSVLLLKNYLTQRIEKNAPIKKSDFDFSVSTFEYKGILPENAPGIEKLSFGAFLRIYQPIGLKGYLSFVKAYAKKLDTSFGAGVCTSDSYLVL